MVKINEELMKKNRTKQNSSEALVSFLSVVHMNVDCKQNLFILQSLQLLKDIRCNQITYKYLICQKSVTELANAIIMFKTV